MSPLDLPPPKLVSSACSVIAGHQFDWGSRTFVMGVINCTDDSFSGDGLGAAAGAAVRQGVAMVAEGADLLDVGAESTRPGFKPVDAGQQMARLVPVIERLRHEVDVPISVDTTRGEVAKAALAAGASVVNDVNGMRGDPAVACAAAAAGAHVVIVHNQRNRPFHDVIGDIRSGLRAGCAVAEAAGIPAPHRILDPGFGFGWRPEHNLEMLRRLSELRDLGRPLLVGTSRKSTIGHVLGLPLDERLEGTAATVALAIARGADLVRVHDVRAMVRVARMSDAIVRGWDPPPVPDSSAEAQPPAQVAIALGGNQGDRQKHLRDGVAALAPDIDVLRVSPLYESAPWGVADQPPFLNAVLLARTALRPLPLLDRLKAIERAAGRAPGSRWGPRPLDLDILLYGAARIRAPRLTVPHPRMAERNFVLRPLADLDPDRLPPGWSRTVAHTLAARGEDGLRRVAGPQWARPLG